MQEQARKALENVIGGKNNEFEKWDKRSRKEKNLVAEMVPMKEETGLDVAVGSTVAVNDGCER